MNNKTVLLIGGKFDGRRMTVPFGQSTIRMRDDIPPVAVTRAQANIDIAVREYTYHQCPLFNGHGGNLEVFAIADWKREDVVAEMIRRYPVESRE